MRAHAITSALTFGTTLLVSRPVTAFAHDAIAPLVRSQAKSGPRERRGGFRTSHPHRALGLQRENEKRPFWAGRLLPPGGKCALIWGRRTGILVLVLLLEQADDTPLSPCGERILFCAFIWEQRFNIYGGSVGHHSSSQMS